MDPDILASAADQDNQFLNIKPLVALSCQLLLDALAIYLCSTRTCVPPPPTHTYTHTRTNDSLLYFDTIDLFHSVAVFCLCFLCLVFSCKHIYLMCNLCVICCTYLLSLCVLPIYSAQHFVNLVLKSGRKKK